MLVKPVSLLNDVTKILYSESEEQYLAIRLRDIKKQDGLRDHLIIQLKDRELLADFVLEYAALHEDDVIFEMNH